MLVFTRRVIVAAAASAAGLLLGGVLRFFGGPTPTRSELATVAEADCQIKNIILDNFMKSSQPVFSEGYKYINAIGFYGDRFKDDKCCNGLRDVTGLIVGAAESGTLATAMPELMTHPAFSVTQEACMPKGSPSKFIVSFETKASKDGAEVGPGVCHAPAPPTGLLPPVFGSALDIKADLLGLSQRACDSYLETAQLSAKAKEEHVDPSQDQDCVEAMTTLKEQLPDAFSMLGQVTFTPSTTAPAQPSNAAGAMLQALGASTEHMASLGSSLLPVSATAIAAKSRPKEEQATFIM